MVFDENILSATRLDGVIVENGNADFLPQLPALPTPQTNNSFGGGILIDGVQVWCTDVRVRDCFAYLGGGIGVRQSLPGGGGGSLRGRRLTVRDNLAGMIGAGLYVADSSEAVIGNSTFRGNVSGGNAGAIFVAEVVIDFELNNSRVFDNAARFLGGGALVASRQSGTQSGTRFINCTIAHNKAASGSGLYFMAGPNGLNIRLVQNTILFQNPSGTNNDNIVSLGAFVVDISNSFLGARAQNPALSIAPTATGSFIDAAGTTLVPGWRNEAARNFKLEVDSVCIDQGADSLLTADRLDIEDDLNFSEDLPREYFMFDEAHISNASSTREVNVLGAGILPPGGNIGADNLSGSVPGPICDIGAHEYRDPQPINGQ